MIVKKGAFFTCNDITCEYAVPGFCPDEDAISKYHVCPEEPGLIGGLFRTSELPETIASFDTVIVSRF